MESKLNGRWNAAQFFADLTEDNILAQENDFSFCRVSGLEGFEEAVNTMQDTDNFVCVSDIADGYTELNNTPRTRRIKTVFFAMRHAAEDMDARSECMETMRELFRQFMSRLLPEKTRLQQSCIYLDPRISFNEIDRYFFSGCACAYFQIAVDVYTDLALRKVEWSSTRKFDLWIEKLISGNLGRAINAYMRATGASSYEAQDLMKNLPQPVLIEVNQDENYEIVNLMQDFVVFKFRLHDDNLTKFRYKLLFLSVYPKLAAIKAYRTYANVGLKEAKDYIESLPQVIDDDADPNGYYGIIEALGENGKFEFRRIFT